MRYFVVLISVVVFGAAYAELPVEPIPHSLSLPGEYPNTWVYVHDMNFNSLVDGKIVVLDVASPTRNYKGSIGAGQFASFAFSTQREELYVAETFYSRRTRGDATDTLTVYDRKNLSPIDEIILPGAKRLKVVTHKHALQLIDNERLALVSNFTPAASVTVVDLEKRKVLGEVQTPACNFTYPTGRRGFSTLCSNGALATYLLREDGSVLSESVSAPFIDIDQDPLFAKTATVDGITYFPSYQGRIQPIDFRTAVPQILAPWDLATGKLKKQNWRPGGWQVIGGAAHRLYVLMHPQGEEGTHKSGGTEVWVFDPQKHQRIARFPLAKGGLSIEVTDSSPGYLVVTSGEMATEVYSAESGKLLRTLKVATDPFIMHAHR